LSISISVPFILKATQPKYKSKLSQNENFHDDKINQLLKDTDFIFRIGKSNKSGSEKLQLLILKLLIILWDENGDDNDLKVMEKKLQIIDDVRHELTFLRAKYFKEIFNQKMGNVF
jgi:hypothetical protein